MSEGKYIDIDVNDDKKAEYLAILNSDYFDSHPGDDLDTAYETLYGDGVSRFFNDYPFTHEQAFRIKDILERKFAHQSVIRFIMKLRFVLEGAACVLHQPDYKTFKNDQKAMMRKLTKCKSLMDDICDARAPIIRFTAYHQLESYNDEYETGSGLSSDCQDLAVKIGWMLGTLIGKLEKLDTRNITAAKGKKGRRTADDTRIIKEIAKTWEKYFGEKPTRYTGSDFAEILEIVLEGLNLKHGDLRRKLTDGLKE